MGGGQGASRRGRHGDLLRRIAGQPGLTRLVEQGWRQRRCLGAGRGWTLGLGTLPSAVLAAASPEWDP